MTIKESIQKIKLLLGGVKLNSLQLSNNSIIEFAGESITLGSEIYLVEGLNSMPLPDGKYITKTAGDFTITNGLVSAVNPTEQPVVQNPVLQAQAADKKPYGDVEYADSKDGKYPIDTVEHIRAAWNYINHPKNADKVNDPTGIREKIIAAWKEKIDPKGPPSAQEQSAQEEIPAVEPVETKMDADGDTDAAAVVTVDINDVIAAALQPVYQAIQDIQTAINNLAQVYVSQDNFSNVEQTLRKNQVAMNSLVDTVNLLANQPSGEPLEAEVINQNFSKIPKDVKESQTYKIMQLAFNNKK